ncbi:MAG TPA: TlpA disulfide reductase family protein [Blastocatellia bacterium]|nr:TlpA disulfide reductase family protein [Blastocatellia bacterium]
MAKKRKKNGGRTAFIVAATAGLIVAGLVAVMLMPTAKAKRYIPPTDPVVSDSVQTSLASLRGKVVILDFWATWCGPCGMEIPGFISLESKYKDKGLEIVGVSLDPITRKGGAAAVAPFMQSRNINYTIWMVNNAAAMAGFDASQGIPTTYLIDRTGKVVNRYVGAQPETTFENDVKRLL